MNLSFYKTVVDSLDSNKKEDLYYLNSVYLNKLNTSNITLKKHTCNKGYILRSLNVNNNITAMQMSLNSFETSKNPKSEEVTSIVEGIKSLCNPNMVGDHWLLTNLINIFSTSKKELKESTNLILSSNPEESVRFYRKKNGSHDPVIIRPTYISDDSLSSIKNNDSDILYLNLPTSNVKIESKPKLYENFLVRKQKRYKLRKAIPPKKITLSRSMIRDINTSLAKGSPEVEEVLKDVGAKLLMNKDRTISMAKDGSSPKRKYKMFKVNKKKTDMNNLNINRRMLRTRRTLVLPAHVNLTAVTNSFDVIHS